SSRTACHPPTGRTSPRSTRPGISTSHSCLEPARSSSLSPTSAPGTSHPAPRTRSRWWWPGPTPRRGSSPGRPSRRPRWIGSTSMTRFLTGSPLSATTLNPVFLDGVVALASGGVVSTGDVAFSEDGLPLSGDQYVSPLDAAGHFHFGLAPLTIGSHAFTVAYA